MKNFKRVLGITIISTILIGMFLWMVQDSSLEIALKTWGASILISVACIFGVMLIASD